ncbi:hypothetical protein GGX14DRAFT_351458 [Mycena pura]|uniref:Cysteine protease n=1 Tax=Mycena pura TaxID=153505 RepID=A0AAD6YNA9_9AGAR|nr:hypothetical protein GGX14DRAFT_351458 [Mycena pura]
MSLNTPNKAVKTASSKSSFLDKAVRYLLDSDSTPDQCPDEIYLLGVRHPGFGDAAENLDAETQSQDSSHHWPAQFYSDFRSRVWCTYRRDFEPIRDGGPRGWTSDVGWGCMLRTGQSLLANTLVNIHVGRDYARSRARHAAYVRLLTWFLDSPAPEAPFSVHRMAMAGKDLGTQVGQWFGPSIAAGAIKALVQAFPTCGLGVSVATDSVLYQTCVFEASHTSPASDPECDTHGLSWGDRPVLLLLGLRLGLEGVNPIYYDAIKQLYTFPQSVGIAGGRPSSSYYFVGAQGDGLFYLDPHHSRPALPLYPPPPTMMSEKDMDEAAEQYYATVYTAADLQTFHCEKVRKMTISGLDPSMLVGFLCRDAEEWADFRTRVTEVRVCVTCIDFMLNLVKCSFPVRYSPCKRNLPLGLPWTWVATMTTTFLRLKA